MWRELQPTQQQALAPLSAQWDALNESQKRKWIAMSTNFLKMSGDEQRKLHSRMTEWVSLSPQQRSIARLNYGETRKLSSDDKKAKWEQYQALSPEEKKALAAKAAAPKSATSATSATAAAAIKPVPRERLASVPQRPRTATLGAEGKTPRIAAAPNQVDHNTLLPQPQAVSLPAAQPQAAPQPPAAAPQQPAQPQVHSLAPQAGTPD